MGRVLLSCIIVSLYYCNMQNAHVTIINDLLTYLLTYPIYIMILKSFKTLIYMYMYIFSILFFSFISYMNVDNNIVLSKNG